MLPRYQPFIALKRSFKEFKIVGTLDGMPVHEWRRIFDYRDGNIFYSRKPDPIAPIDRESVDWHLWKGVRQADAVFFMHMGYIPDPEGTHRVKRIDPEGGYTIENLHCVPTSAG